MAKLETHVYTNLESNSKGLAKYIALCVISTQAEKISQLIRRTEPKHMEVQRDFMFNNNNRTYIINDIDKDMFVFGLHKTNRDGVSNPRLEYIKALENKIYEPIGKRINFLDVMTFLSKYETESNHYRSNMDFDGSMGVCHLYTDGDIESSEGCQWDMNSIYLDEQPDEVINFLLNFELKSNFENLIKDN